MRRLYSPTNKLVRAQYHHAAAAECARAGFPGFAEYNSQQAQWLETQVRFSTKAAEEMTDGDR